MSEEDVVVRQPIALRVRPRRGLDERFLIRFPRATAALVRVVLRRPPNSWLRRVMIRRTMRRAIEAVNRGDYEAGFAVLPADYETTLPPEFVGLGMEPVYYGREGRLRLMDAWIAQWGDLQQEMEEVIDLGDRLLLLGQMEGSGQSSGARFETEIAYLVTVFDGRLVGERNFRSHDQALEAAGLSE